MAKEWAKPFYKSAAWEKARDAALWRSHSLCVRCKERGKLTPARVVHHMVPLTPENIDDPAISLNLDLLMPLCHECHGIVHDELGVGAPFVRSKAERELDEPRVGFDAFGNVVPLSHLRDM